MFTSRFFLIICLLGMASAATGHLHPAIAEEVKAYEIELKDGVITPNRLEVEAGTTFEIVARNTGTTPAEFESLRLRKETIVAPGATSSIVIHRLSPGTYKFFDHFHIHMKSAHGAIVAK